MKEITLTNSPLKALVDDEDFERVSKYKWHIGKNSNSYPQNKSEKKIYLHRIVMDAISGQTVDHIDGNKLDARKSNLRKCSQLQNTWNNRTVKLSGASKYRGVKYITNSNPRNKRWYSSFKMNGKHISVGYFLTEQEAVKAYNKKIVEYRGEYAVLNIIED